MGHRLKNIGWGLGIGIVVANVVFLDWALFDMRNTIEEQNQLLTQTVADLNSKLTSNIEANYLSSDEFLTVGEMPAKGCDEECMEIITEEVDKAIAAVEVAAPETAEEAVVVRNTGTFYVPLGSSGSTISRDWVEIGTTATEIDWSQYTGNLQVYWEAFARVYQGNGEAFVRLYDKTNEIEVPGSVMSAKGEVFVHLKSPQIYPWIGTNTYVVQVKSLTGYEAFYEGGKIKIVAR